MSVAYTLKLAIKTAFIAVLFTTVSFITFALLVSANERYAVRKCEEAASIQGRKAVRRHMYLFSERKFEDLWYVSRNFYHQIPQLEDPEQRKKYVFYKYELNSWHCHIAYSRDEQTTIAMIPDGLF